MKTVSAKTVPENRRWYLVDATDLTLGRLASQVASRLRGKHQPTFTPHADTGDFIIVINAEKVRLTGRKWQQKTYHRHTGYMGGLKSITETERKEARRSGALCCVGYVAQESSGPEALQEAQSLCRARPSP